MNIPATCESLMLDNQLCHRLYVVSNAITRAYRPFLEHLNLTYPQYVVMMALWEKEDVVISELQQKTLIDRGALTLILKKLQEKVYIQMTCSDTDKRKKHITLSEAGRSLQQTALAFPNRLACKSLQFNDAEMAQLIHSVDKLKKQLLMTNERNSGDLGYSD